MDELLALSAARSAEKVTSAADQQWHIPVEGALQLMRPSGPSNELSLIVVLKLT